MKNLIGQNLTLTIPLNLAKMIGNVDGAEIMKS